MSDSSVLNAIREMLAERTATPLERVSADTKLYTDLGMDGDDAWEFLEAFSKKFTVTFDGFVFLDHFNWEAHLTITPVVIGIAWLVLPDFRRKWRKAVDRQREITVAHLVHCAELGRWVPSSVRQRKSSQWRWWTPIAFAFAAIQTFAGLAILILGAALVIGGPFILADYLAEGDIKHSLITVLLMAVFGGVAFAEIRAMRAFLRDKQVWERTAPVTE